MTEPNSLLLSQYSYTHRRTTFSRLLSSIHRICHPAEALSEETGVPSHVTHVPEQSTSPPWKIEDLLDHTHNHLRPQLPGSCKWLEREALPIEGKHPIDAGGSADVLLSRIGDHDYAVKSYRCYSSTSYLPIYERFRGEALACSCLKHRNIVPFIGVYSTPKYPLGLVLEYMEHNNLREYLRTNESVERRTKLLLDIACGVEHMHKLDFVHGNLKISNILVDSSRSARVAGLGVASNRSPMPGVEIDRSFYGAAPELVYPQRFGLTDSGATKESDVYAFGFLAWEVFAGQVPFSNESRNVGVYSMVNGRRPPRPDHPELSDRVWEMIEGSWVVDPAQRMTITEVVSILDAEVNPHRSQ